MSDDVRYETSDDMWRQRAEAAEEEVRALRGTGSAQSAHMRSMMNAVEIYQLATRLVSLVGMYPPDDVARAISMLRPDAVRMRTAEPCDSDGWYRLNEDGEAMMAIIRMMERLAWPKEWHASVQQDIEEAEGDAESDGDWPDLRLVRDNSTLVKEEP
jgi:hypothetical protein